jgi:ubiquinone/menaquinone biosynthesis C-methylase UbiE
MNEHRHYLPAAGHDFFLPLYDLVAKILGVDRARRALLDNASVPAGSKLLDLGCGTGSFSLLLKRNFPGAEVTGLDPDPKALARAQKKAKRARQIIRFDQGFADALPYAARSFDAAFSSFMFHHLEAANREQSLREACRVLKPGGIFHLLDLEVSDSSHGFCLFHSRELLRDNTEERILALLGSAGFADSRKVSAVSLISGHAACYQAAAPA